MGRAEREQTSPNTGRSVVNSAPMDPSLGPMIDAGGGANATVHSGVDLLELGRWRDVHARHGARFLDRIYTTREQDYCGDRQQELAARFAAKEAVMKALGTGVRGVGWREIEILANGRGKPIVLLHGRARARANRLGFRRVEISMTHEREITCAFAVAIGEGAA